MTRFCNSLTAFSRRKSYEVSLSEAHLGGKYPISVQSMTNTDTNDIEKSIEQIKSIVAAGGDIVRLTVQGDKEAENLRVITQRIKAEGVNVALVADVHFKASVALKVAHFVDKVRVNPGNFPNAEQTFPELLDICSKRGVAIRIGVNHGSLASEVVEKFGDTKEGMVYSAMEFLRVCVKHNFYNVAVSMKSSNVRVMVEAYRLLVAAMNDEAMHFALHLGVTEAGEGADARIKSAAGVGALLSDGIGDTLRVSLTEDPVNEIPVGRALVEYFKGREIEDKSVPEIINEELYSPYDYKKREVEAINNVPMLYSELSDEQKEKVVILEAKGANPSAFWRAEILNMMANGDLRPVIIKRTYDDSNLDDMQLKAASDMGVIFLDGLADGLWIDAPSFSQSEIDATALSILQATRVRMSKTEYIACPGCGRTQYNLNDSLKVIKERTSHLKGLKIAVMGCIVNGPGEMADADYGYVGSGKGKITLYKGKEVIKRGIDQADALDELVELIRANGDWK